MGNGVWISLNEHLLAQGLAAGVSDELLATLVRGSLLGAGASIPGKKGEPLTQESAQLKALQQQATQLEQQGLAWLQSLGVLAG